ncbi:MAG TPA: hypothetical protein VKU60_07975, partial [Chloroflexota bacterium]|nr:hypothetical protein [Chloroflexota bacterium]
MTVCAACGANFIQVHAVRWRATASLAEKLSAVALDYAVGDEQEGRALALGEGRELRLGAGHQLEGVGAGAL